MVPGENSQVVIVEQHIGNADDDVQFDFIVKNGLSDQADGDLGITEQHIALTLPGSVSPVYLVEEVAKRLNCHPDSIELYYEHRKKNTKKTVPCVIHSGEKSKSALTDYRFDVDKKNILELHKRTNHVDYSTSEEVEFERGEWFGKKKSSSTYVPPPAPPPYTTGTSDYLYNYSYSSALIKQDTGFVGLVNQAMTCYLNSLLQTLYMTPEFRNALYRWEFDGTEEEGTKSIPYQLQRLFLQLQTSKKPAVGTTQLTTSFGWDSSEAWQQHDVQELCRVMFDALEQKFRNTEQADLISTLYEGKLKDYVKCLECGNESAREDTFLDVPLVVRPFGSSQAYGSVKEALEAFVAPEVLQDSNQYFCEKCCKKCDAHKGLKFTKFPYLLTLQLKRFDFDPVTMHRIKLNDKVTFPQILNINSFIKTESTEDSCDDGDAADSGSALDDEGLCCPSGFKTANSISPEGSSDTTIDPADDDEGIDVGNASPNGLSSQEISTNEKNLRKSMEKGPYVYELFSIMVHSGSANGGHYYAYIKNFSDGEWYCFNDVQVSRITYEDIQKTYGGGPARGYYSSAYSSSTNAYMLMYRQIDKERNAECMATEHFPDHIKVLLQNMQEQEEKERQQRELDRYMCKIKLFCHHPVQKRMVEMRLKVHKDSTLAEATATARSIMGLESVVPLDCCRLIKYDDFHDSLECSFDGMEEEPIGELLGGARASYKFDLLLETKSPNQQFQQYKPGGTTVKIQIVDMKLDEVLSPRHTLRCHLSETVGAFKSQIAKCLGISANTMRVALEPYKLLENNSNTLKSEGFGRSSRVFVEYQDQEDAKKPFTSSKFYSMLECYSYTICIHISLPKVDKAFLEKMHDCENDVEGSGSSSEDDDSDAGVTVRVDRSGKDSTGHLISNQDADVRQNHCTDVASNAECTNLVTTQSNPQELWLKESKAQLSGSGSIELTKKGHPAVTSDDSSQDCDEGLGDSEIGDTCSSNSYQSCPAVHSDHSEDSSLTDSERTLVGYELSPRNNSPDIMGTEMEVDANPSQGAVSDAVGSDIDSAHSSDESFSFQVSSEVLEKKALGRLTKFSRYSKFISSERAERLVNREQRLPQQDTVCNNTVTASSPPPPVKRYFRAFPYTDCETGEKMLRTYVDKRITLAALKKELECFVEVGTDYFKIHRVYSSNQEFECTSLSENLMSYTEDTKLAVKLERALRKGEYKVKIYQLCINDSEPIKYLMDWVFVKGTTVLQVKKKILPEIKETCGLEVPLNRCRLRKKSWKNPGPVFLDHMRFGKDIPINTKSSNWEIFLEILEDAEPVSSPSEQTVFIKRWRPSTYELEPFQEIVVNPPAVEGLRAKISEVSGIPKEFVEFAKGQGTFPCEVSVLSIHKELDWFSSKSTMNTWSWSVCFGDDGLVVYYRDSREELKKLTEEEKREITNRENARSNKIQKAMFSPRKEKALKIYTLDSMPSKSSSSSSNGANSASAVGGAGENAKLVVPDLD